MKNVLITGSAKGIGYEIARQCSLQGDSVIISGRNQAKLNAAQEKLAAAGCLVETLLMDVSDPELIKHAAHEFAKRKLPLDVLINNAGILLPGDNVLSKDADVILTTTVNSNSYGPLRVSNAFIPFMKRGSHIINISSGGGSMTDPVGGWSPAYCVSKTLLNGITRHLAYELSSKGIAVNAVCPGWVKTDMGGQGATRPLERGAETPVWLANGSAGERSGYFFRDKKVIPW
ncbi:MAG TPA: SDR family NAD(P)-dependent oxidoreductase [Bacteroidia bacterium]|nr:SDR family NAD(P)-dependent oxidoreductase [Bacteroidia bacterium]